MPSMPEEFKKRLKVIAQKQGFNGDVEIFFNEVETALQTICLDGLQFFDDKELSALMEEDNVDETQLPNSSAADKEFRLDLVGYPRFPLYLHIANFLAIFMLSGTSLATFLPKMYLLNEGIHPEERKTLSIWSKERATGAVTLWPFWTIDQKTNCIRKLLTVLGKRGILDILLMRHTFGSLDVLPMPKYKILEACLKPNSTTKLTVCGRALSKHKAREISDSFWPVIRGNEEAVNKMAIEMVDKILSNASWINVHGLPGDLPVMEIRVESGQGIRFEYSPFVFRGFVEPMQEQGWLTKYRH